MPNTSLDLLSTSQSERQATVTPFVRSSFKRFPKDKNSKYIKRRVGKRDMSNGARAGVIVGGLFGMVLIGVLILAFMSRGGR